MITPSITKQINTLILIVFVSFIHKPVISEESNSVSLWMWSVYGMDLGRNLTDSFLSEWANHNNTKLLTSTKTNPLGVFENCQEDRFDVIITAASQKLKSLVKECNYKAVATSHSKSMLFTLKGKTFDEIKSIAVVESTRHFDFAQKKLKSLMPGVQVKPVYSAHLLSIELLKGNVDAFIASPVALAIVAEKFRKDISPIITLQTSDALYLIFDNNFSLSTNGEKTLSYFVENTEENRNLFGQKFGLSNWEAIDSGRF